MAGSDTKELILNAAEYCFARDGFHNTSLRMVTGRAKVNLAAVNYHFGSKEALLQAVFERRLIPLNKIRRENLEKVRDNARKEGCKPSVRDVMHAFIEPTFRVMASGPEAKDFIALVGRALSEPDDTVRNIFIHIMWPVFILLFEALGNALPELPKNVLFWRLQFSMGAMAHTLHISHKSFPEHNAFMRIISETDIDSLIEIILKYITSGLEAS